MSLGKRLCADNSFSGGSQVLGSISGHGLPQSRHGNDAEALQPGSCRVAGKHLGSEWIDDSLDQHGADGDSSLLEDRRKGDAGDGGEFGGAEQGGVEGNCAGSGTLIQRSTKQKERKNR